MKIQSSIGVQKYKVFYARVFYGKEEKQAVMKSLDNQWLASGLLVKQFEGEVSKLFGKKYGVAVNSGSSANLLAIKALKMKEGSEVITPACTFATTVSEIVNNNLVPVFIDVVIGRYTIDESLVESAITNKTKAILVPQLIGGICDMQKLRRIANKYKLYLIDDSCDTFAPTLKGKTVASYADVSTTSFYASHIITACGMGGMVITDNEKLRDQVITLRDWGRMGNDSEEFEKRFNFKIDNIPYDAKFLYSEFGYNLKMNESAAAFGLEQLKRLPGFIKQRKENFKALTDFLLQYEKYFYLPKLIEGADTNWLAYPLTIKKGSPFTRYELLKHLDKKGIQVRVLFAGNITRHPVYRKNNLIWRSSGSFKNSDHIMANGFLLGCHHVMGKQEVDYICNSFAKFMKDYI